MIDSVVLRKNVAQEIQNELVKFKQCLERKVDRSLTDSQLDRVIAKLAQALYLDLLVSGEEEKLLEEFKETVGKLSWVVNKAYA